MDTRKELEARFGPDPRDWPAPYAGQIAEGDTGRLHDALRVDGDETFLERAVLTRLAMPPPGILPVILPPRVALAGYLGLWFAMAVLGYQVLGGMLGDPVLELALGEVPGWELAR